MKEFKGYKQLTLNDVDWYREENRTKNPWKGKVIERVGFCNRGDYDDKMLIILFTDKTFLAIELERDEDEFQFADAWMYDIWDGHEGAEARYGCWVDSNRKVHLGTKIQMMVDLGLWDFTEEDAERIRKEEKRKEEEREWQNYLRLREKFKERIENEEKGEIL